jgi:hypothetical protein
MTNRRSLTAALKITPEAAAFIEHGPPTNTDQEPPPLVELSDPIEPSLAPPQIEHDALEDNEATVAKRKPRPKKVEKERGEPDQSSRLTALTTPAVSITVRLRQSTAEALRRASLERKLQGLTPHSQQEIVESAVSQWLKDNAYLDSLV